MPLGAIGEGVDLEKLLAAIKRVETSDGLNNWPRVEAAYIPEGLKFTIQGRIVVGNGRCMNEVSMPRWRSWGLSSSASWGPWQILYQTAADNGYGGPPWDLHGDATSEPYVISHLRKLEKRGAKTVRDFADGWNSGSFKDTNLVVNYTDAVNAAYNSIT